MTKLYVSNGQLQIVTPEKLTTNAINAYEVGIEFEQDWNAYDKTAVFYQTTKGKRFYVKIAGDTVMIPADVLQVNLPVYVGFVGKKGNVKKTSNFVKLEIDEGADYTESSVSFVQTVDTQILFIRLNNGEFEYSIDGNSWVTLETVAKIQINGVDVPTENKITQILTDTDYIDYKASPDGKKRLSLSETTKDTIKNKLDKTGGVISGDLTVQGDMKVAGTTTTEHVEQLSVKHPVIIANGNKVDLQTLLAGLAINKNASATYGIMYDPVTNTVLFGEGTVDDDDHFTFNEGEGLPLAVRADSSTFTNAHLVKWNAAKNMFEDAGFALSSLKIKNITLNNASTGSFASDDGITVSSKGTVKYEDDTTSEVTSEIDLPIFGDGQDISIDGDATNENVHIKGVDYLTLTLPASAYNGTLTNEQYAQLVNKNGNVLVVNNELYRLEDKGHEEGFLTYTHVGITGTQQYIKTLTITISTKAFTIITTPIRDLQCVNITLPESATSGTLTEEQFNRLTAYDMNMLCINGNEYYRLNDKGHTEGINTYTHDGFNEKGVTKYLNLTLSTRAFKITTENNGTDVKIDSKTITTNTSGQIQAVALTNGTDTLSYADILQAMTIERL